MARIRVADIFSGVGGLSYGFSTNPAFSIEVANEIHSMIARAYSLNHKNTNILNCDIALITEKMFDIVLNGKQIDIIVGGPPCQSYSTAGKRQNDARANLFMEYKRILQILCPSMFIFENVTGILSMNRGELFKRVQAEFESIHYDLKYQVMDAADYGVPQHRKRVILVGTYNTNKFKYPPRMHGEGLLPYVTLSDAIGDLPPLQCGEENNTYLCDPYNDFLQYVRNGSDSLTEHKAPNNSESMKVIMRALKDGESKNDLSPEIIVPKGFGNSYAKLWWNRPATTVTTNFSCPSSARCIHPRDSRALTIREGARLQSFPDTYLFHGTDTVKRLEIGNAVPPLLSKAIADEAAKYLTKRTN